MFADVTPSLRPVELGCHFGVRCHVPNLRPCSMALLAITAGDRLTRPTLMGVVSTLHVVQ